MKELMRGAAIALLTIATSAAAAALKPLIREATAVKHAALIKRAYRALNPWILANTSLGRSELYRGVRRGIAMLADGNLDAAELELITTLLLRRFDLLKASDGLAPPQKDAMVVAEEMDAAIARYKRDQEVQGVRAYSTSAKDLL